MFKISSICKNFVSLLFSFHIFFGAVVYSLIQFRFLLLLLIFPIFFKINKLILFKFLKYFLFSAILSLHLVFQAQTISVNSFYPIFVFFLILVILDVYQIFFFKNLNMIIYLFLIIFFMFILYSFFPYDNYLNQVSSSCVGCFSILRIFFNENSHLAIIAPSVIFYLLFISEYNKFINYIFITFFLVICFVNPSLTLYLGFFFFTSFYFVLSI